MTSARNVLRDRALVPATILIIALHQATIGDVSEATWMAREGLDLLAGSPLIHPDHWSWAPVPWDFQPTSPVWQYLSAFAWTFFGTSGFPLLTFLVTATALAVIAGIASKLGAKPAHISIALGYALVVERGFMSARASLPAFMLLLAALAYLWSRLRNAFDRRARNVVLLVVGVNGAVSFCGIWLHQSWGTYAIALAVLQVPLLLASTVDRKLVVAGSVAGAGAGLGAVLLGPTRWNVWQDSVRLADACRGLVQEWKSPWEIGTWWVTFWILCVTLLALIVINAWRHRKSVSELELLLIAVGTVHIAAGTQAIRFIPLGAIALAPSVALMLGRVSTPRRLQRLRQRLGERGTETYWRNALALAMAPLLIVTLLGLGRSDFSEDPAFRRLPQQCRLFSDDTTAKWVVLYRPDVKIWVDGRHHYWQRERLLDGQRYLQGTSALVPPGTSCVMLRATGSPALRARLNAASDWRLLTTSDDYAVWSRLP